jgi:hypothetical protein
MAAADLEPDIPERKNERRMVSPEVHGWLQWKNEEK